MKIKMIDPPSGWLFGFPKEIPNEVENVTEWLVENGYPKAKIDELGSNFWCRFWYEDVA